MVYGGGLRFAAVIGVVFGSMAGALQLRPALAGALFGAMGATVDICTMMAFIGGAEVFVPRTRLGLALARAPFFAEVLVKALAYLAVVSAVIGGRLGPQVAALAMSPELARDLLAQVETAYPRDLLVVISGLVTVLLVMLREATKVVGDQAMRDIIRGRYRRPRAEERFFLFIDIVGSTPVAERLGPLAVHRYLDRVFQVASDPIDEWRGDVYQYVGDEIVITWALAEGRPQARPLGCLFAVEAALAQAAPEFEREFGALPRLRAALHAGEVVTGEIGGSRRAIVFHGDVMNTTSRLENATRELGHPFLVSEDALARMEGARAFALEDLGPRPLRGREAPVRVYAVGRPA
jgi:adenylate cyclase